MAQQQNTGESTVSPLTISKRAEALEAAEKAAPAPKAEPEAKAEPEVKPEAKAEVKAEVKPVVPENKTEVKPESKPIPNDPTELRKWNTKVSQENAQMRKELASIKAEQEKVFKLLSSMSKKPIDYKELAKNPEAIQKVIEEERENATRESQERLDELSAKAKSNETMYERVKREHDIENYPEWKRVFPEIVKMAQAGDSRVDFTQPAGDVLDALYELALQANPKPAAAVVPEEKVYKEEDFKAAVADAVAKEKEAIAKTAREEAMKQAQKELAEESKGQSIASSGKGAGRVPSDHLAAFKKMSLSEQRDWLIQQGQA